MIQINTQFSIFRTTDFLLHRLAWQILRIRLRANHSTENENWLDVIVVAVDVVPIRSESSCDIYRIDKIPSN